MNLDNKIRIGILGLSLLFSSCGFQSDKFVNGNYKDEVYQKVGIETVQTKRYVSDFGRSSIYDAHKQRGSFCISWNYKSYSGDLKIPKELFADKGSSVTTADMDNDGDQDIIILKNGSLSIIENKILQENDK